MKLKSLALKTDLIFTKQNGEVLDRGDYLVVKTHSNPNFYWGNLLIFDEAPKNKTLSDWVELFNAEFTDPRIYHKTFAWDSEEIGDIQQFEAAGYKFEKSIVLTAAEKEIKAPKIENTDIEITRLKKADWQGVIKVQAATNPQYESFYAQQALDYQKMIDKGLGEWFGAYLNQELVGSLGIFREDVKGGTIGRYQIVSTHPAHQRKGVCSTLVYRTAQYAFEQMNIKKLVMVADEDYHAARIYESVGFHPIEKMYGVCLSGT